ncbi:hybrid sensor histidine kinase/response regulator [Thalassovita taeanensis]|uniref:histidine kinase n=1 Tax=Thalassovita taeanensis TaxID=657014 RepID=A0A1H9H7Y1_9RHOB|nr:ATP-binding protein [Thalassovita taeanensis]SEQ58373.1 PAS domain S-box-containing protein [Thalassovita taeanensis]
MTSQEITTTRFYNVGIAALILLLLTVMLGLYLGGQTRSQFREVEASWTDYDGDVGQKGVWISSLRGYLGYGGIIHNFKNYVLRGAPEYFERTGEQIEQFNATMAQYLDGNPREDERTALLAIQAIIDQYAAKLPVARDAVARGLSLEQVDVLVAVDDSRAIQALVDLEAVWQTSRAISTSRMFAAVDQGQTLILIGFVSIGLLVFAALSIGALLIMMLRDMRGSMSLLSDELVRRRKLEQSEGRLASAVEQSPSTIFITDTRGRILYANRRFAQLTGWTSAEVEGKTPKFLQTGDTKPEVYEEIRKCLGQGKEWHGVFRNRKKDGGSYWVETKILPLIGPDGTVQNFIGLGEDVTEKRQAREQVARAQKLEAVGLLAGGIAHDFNNVLTTIVGAAHLAALDAPEGSDIAMEIEQIDIAAQRAQSLVHGLLTFARREPGKPQAINLCDIVREVTRLLRASLPPTIHMTCADEHGKFLVMADHTHLHQIVMNLCRNAAEAIGGAEGSITISVTKLSQGLLEDQKPRPEGWVQLEIRDDGPGMSLETRKHLFDPFFTTKPLGKGSGLGLVVVAGLVEEMGGTISVESAPGEGACFTIRLPGTSQSEAVPEITAKDIPRGHERLILVDDQPEIAATFRRVLMRLGYRVEAYTSSVIALEKMRADPNAFDLLITDMVMPEMNGEVLANLVRDHRADVPVIICTGYNPSGISIQGAPVIVLNKPIDPLDLARQIRWALDSAKAHAATVPAGAPT